MLAHVRRAIAAGAVAPPARSAARPSRFIAEPVAFAMFIESVTRARIRSRTDGARREGSSMRHARERPR